LLFPAFRDRQRFAVNTLEEKSLSRSDRQIGREGGQNHAAGGFAHLDAIRKRCAPDNAMRRA
jgi:hypothetical protein